MKNSRSLFGLAMVIFAFALSGCYRNQEITESEVGLAMNDGITISSVKYTGRYTDGSYWASMTEIDTSAKTLQWADPDLITSDKQIIGVDVGVTYRRTRDAAAVVKLFSDYPTEAQDDVALASQVNNRMARTIKNLTGDYTLDELLGTAVGSDKDRTTAQNDAYDALKIELAEFGVELIDLGINNINPSESYRTSLDIKAKAIVDVEVSQKQTLFLQEQLKQEKAQTAIALEKADRDNQVALINATLLTQSPEAFQLEKIKAMAAMFNDQDKIYFIQPGTDLTLLMGPTDATPVIQEITEQK